MSEHDCDELPIAAVVRAARSASRMGIGMTPLIDPVDADDCAPGLESIYEAMTAAADREAPCPKCGSPGGPFTGFGLAGGGFGFYAGCSDCGAFEKHQTSDEPPDDVDRDRCDRPPLDISPALAVSRSASLAGYIFGRGCDTDDCAAGLVVGPSFGDSP